MLRIVFRLALITLLTLGVIKTSNSFLTKPVFEIKNAEINGGSEKLRKSLEPLINEIVGKNINDLDLESIEKKISEDIRIENVVITRDSLNKISINIAEREPKYYLQYQGNIYLLDKEGNIYGYLNDLKTKDFPFIVIKDEKEIETILGIISKIEETDFKDIVSQIYIEDKNTVKVILSDGTVIKTDKDVKKEKYYIGSYLFFDLSNKNKVEYIDLRYEDYIVKYVEDKNGR